MVLVITIEAEAERGRNTNSTLKSFRSSLYLWVNLYGSCMPYDANWSFLIYTNHPYEKCY